MNHEIISTQVKTENKLIQEFHFKHNGQLTTHESWGAAKIIWEFDGKYLKCRSHYGLDGELVRCKYSNSAVIKWEYYDNGMTQESHYDENGNLVRNRVNNAAVIQWLSNDDIYEQRFFDENLNLVEDLQTGAAVIRQNKKDSQLIIHYFDAKGNLTSNRESGSAIVLINVTTNDDLVHKEEKYLSELSDILYIKKTKYKNRILEDDLILEESFYDKHGNLKCCPVCCDNNEVINAAIVRYQYFDEDEDPITFYFDHNLKTINKQSSNVTPTKY